MLKNKKKYILILFVPILLICFFIYFQPIKKEEIVPKITNEETNKTTKSKNEILDTTHSSLFDKCKYYDLKENSFYKNNYELLHNKETGAYNLYHLTFEDFKKFNLVPFFRKLGYKMNNDEYPNKLFVFGCYNFSNDLKGITFLNNAEGGYRLHLVVYKNNNPVSIYPEDIAFSWGDIGYINHTTSKFIAPNSFLIETKEYLQNKMTKDVSSKIVINEKGEIIKYNLK